MSEKVTMIMPMAGRGSRFAAKGEVRPKPMIEIGDAPFFDWASRGIVDVFPKAQLIFVVLQEHINNYDIDEIVLKRFPSSNVIAVPQVTSGSLETALIGLQAADRDAHIIINDCDHAFSYPQLHDACRALKTDAAGFLSHFHSDSPNFSFALYDVQGNLIETAEKRVISNRAIAGIYGFRDASTLEQAAKLYSEHCPYPELFVSGIYNDMVQSGQKVCGYDLKDHMAFGTPEEFLQAESDIGRLKGLFK